MTASASIHRIQVNCERCFWTARILLQEAGLSPTCMENVREKMSSENSASIRSRYKAIDLMAAVITRGHIQTCHNIAGVDDSIAVLLGIRLPVGPIPHRDRTRQQVQSLVLPSEDKHRNGSIAVCLIDQAPQCIGAHHVAAITPLKLRV